MIASTPRGQQHPVTVTSHGERVDVIFRGALYSSMARALEEQLQDPRLRGARLWVFDMRALERIDLVCAYALLRAASGVNAPSVVVSHPNRRVQRTLHHAGLHAVATFDV
ncbi:STAS domain-containing protein [Streptomyces sp. NPDC048389]|uniref:STAS domain-containing protein n=1 Tax=Streptomyces sp. NPDC048389 TaxID=3154622 RepID=UPI003453A956